MVATVLARRTKLSAVGGGDCSALLLLVVVEAVDEDDTVVGATDDDNDDDEAVTVPEASAAADAKSVPIRTDNPTPNPYGTIKVRVAKLYEMEWAQNGTTPFYSIECHGYTHETQEQ